MPGRLSAACLASADRSCGRRATSTRTSRPQAFTAASMAVRVADLSSLPELAFIKMVMGRSSLSTAGAFSRDLQPSIGGLPATMLFQSIEIDDSGPDCACPSD
jgi:hypothetical protein